MTPKREQEYRAGTENALRRGREILQAAGRVLMRSKLGPGAGDDPHLNAAGARSSPAQEQSMDAAIMDGKTLGAGAVAGIEMSQSIVLARAVRKNRSMS